MHSLVTVLQQGTYSDVLIPVGDEAYTEEHFDPINGPQEVEIVPFARFREYEKDTGSEHEVQGPFQLMHLDSDDELPTARAPEYSEESYLVAGPWQLLHEDGPVEREQLVRETETILEPENELAEELLDRIRETPDADEGVGTKMLHQLVVE